MSAFGGKADVVPTDLLGDEIYLAGLFRSGFFYSVSFSLTSLRALIRLIVEPAGAAIFRYFRSPQDVPRGSLHKIRRYRRREFDLRPSEAFRVERRCCRGVRVARAISSSPFI